jgi:hypothetical protein
VRKVKNLSRHKIERRKGNKKKWKKEVSKEEIAVKTKTKGQLFYK